MVTYVVVEIDVGIEVVLLAGASVVEVVRFVVGASVLEVVRVVGIEVVMFVVVDVVDPSV